MTDPSHPETDKCGGCNEPLSEHGQGPGDGGGCPGTFVPHPEGQSPVQPTCEGCGLPRREGATDSGVPLCYVDWSGWRGREPSHVKDNCASRTIARLRAELAQQKQFGLDRLAQHVEEEQAAHAEVATLRAENAALVAGDARLLRLVFAAMHVGFEETRSDYNGRISLAHNPEIEVPTGMTTWPEAQGFSEWVTFAIGELRQRQQVKP